MVNGGSGSSGSSETIETTMSNSALKVKCPFCELMFAARYTFHQHLCDRHYKEALAERVPSQPPYLCPVQGCGYVAKDSRQSLVRHYGMTHKVIVELLKRHAPEYVDDPFSDHKQVAQPPQQQQQQLPVPPVQQQQPNIEQPLSTSATNQYYQPSQQYQEYYPPPPQQQQQQHYPYNANAGGVGQQVGGSQQGQLCPDLNFDFTT